MIDVEKGGGRTWAVSCPSAPRPDVGESRRSVHDPIADIALLLGSGVFPRGMNDEAIAAFESDGAQLFKGALKPCIGALEEALSTLPQDEAGIRLRGIEALAPLLASKGCIGAIATSVLGENARPVRAILFNKSPETNWSLGWHQDRTICVTKKREAPGFGPWTVKRGMIHVAPPFDLLTRMVTVRAHLDDVPATNAPLLIAPGSQKRGRVLVDEIDQVVELCGTHSCIAEVGDIWLYSTPILHASEAASVPKSRRVLQVDFAAETLPFGLEWLGI